MILSAQSIRLENSSLIDPFYEHEQTFMGTTYGLGPAGYSVRINSELYLEPKQVALASTMERLAIPIFLKGRVCDKSTWARKFISVANTVIQPGWHGFLTLEITNNSNELVIIEHGMGIAEIEFLKLDMPTDMPYRGKYQAQEPGPQGPRS